MTTVDSIPVWNYLLIGVFNTIHFHSSLEGSPYCMPAVWTHHYSKNDRRIFSLHCYTMHYTYSLPLHLYPDQLSRLVVTARYLLILVQKYKIISSHLVGAHSGPSLEFSCLMHMLSKRIVAWNELSPRAYWCILESCMVKKYLWLFGHLALWYNCNILYIPSKYTSVLYQPGYN